MDERLTKTIDTLQKRFIVQLEVFRDCPTLFVSPEQVLELLRSLRDDHGFDMLVDVTAVDYFPQEEPRFHVVYQVRDIRNNLRITLRSGITGRNPHLRSVESIFPNANWYEREIWDMFGIRFDGHSDLRRILMPYDWETHPLRKDSPLGYEEVQFTFNAAEIARNKPHPKE